MRPFRILQPGTRTHHLQPGRSFNIRRALNRLWVLILIAGCAAPLRAITVEPDVDFAAHTERHALVVDRMGDGDPAVLLPHTGWFTENPFLLEQDGKTVAAVWVKDNAHVTVRQEPDRSSPVTGRVEATRQDGAIRLSFTLADGSTYGTGRFHRVDFSSGPAFLGVPANTVLDVRGMYRAEVRDVHGQPIGWLRVRVDPPEGTFRVYDGDLPPALDGPLGVAAAELVNVDVDDMAAHATDVYIGN